MTGKTKYQSVALGYGDRSDFTKQPHLESVPASIYNHHELNSIDGRVKNTLSVGKNDSFGNTYDKYDN